MTLLAKVLVTIFVFLVLCVPYNSFYTIVDIRETEIEWFMEYIIMYIEYLPMLFLWVLYLFKVKNRVFYMLSMIYSIVLLISFVGVHLVPIQDYSPSYGLYLGALIFPVFLIDYIYRNSNVTSKYPV